MDKGTDVKVLGGVLGGVELDVASPIKSARRGSVVSLIKPTRSIAVPYGRIQSSENCAGVCIWQREPEMVNAVHVSAHFLSVRDIA